MSHICTTQVRKYHIRLRAEATRHAEAEKLSKQQDKKKKSQAPTIVDLSATTIDNIANVGVFMQRYGGSLAAVIQVPHMCFERSLL